MNAITWQRLQHIVETASELPASEREEFLDTACGDNPSLRKQAAEMLAALEGTDSVLERAVGAAVAKASVFSALAVGDRLGPYRVTGVAGSGGMGTVYLAERSDDQFRQKVAVKVVHGGFGASEDLFIRFRAERQILANINHPNIARLLDGGVSDAGFPYLVMEFVEGTNLDQYAAQRHLSTPQRLRLFQQICSAIQYAHQNLIVHRDIKPANVLVTKDGVPKLLDFGIAKLLEPELSGYTVAYTRAVERLMTPEYASPEQIRGETITTATDVYGLGVLLYELLTGVRPFRLAKLSPAEIEKLICQTAPVPPSMANREGDMRPSGRLSADLDRIVLKAIHKEAARRYPTAAEFSADVERYLSGFPVNARPDSFGYRASRFVQRNRIAVAGVLLFILTVTGLVILLALQTRVSQQEAQSADAVSNYLVGLFEFTEPNQTQGRSTSAREILDRGTDRLEAKWTGPANVKARLMNSLGIVYYKLGALDRAQNLISQSSKIYTTDSHTKDSIQAADTVNTLGLIAQDQGNFTNAAKHFEQALRIAKASGKSNKEALGDIVNNLGSLNWTNGNFKEAENYYRQAIQIYSAATGPNSANTLLAEGNLETVFADEGNYKAAEPLIRRVLAGRIKLLGLYNTNVGFSLNNLGFVLDRTARFSEARRYYQQALEVRKKLYGPDHPEVAEALIAIGWLDRELGNYKQAQRLTEEGRTIATRLLGKQSLKTAFAEDSLGLVYLQSGNPSAARPWVESALQTRLSKKPLSQPLLSQSYDHLGLIALAEGDLINAKRFIESALQVRQKIYKADNDFIAESFNHLGRVLYAEGDASGSLQQYRNGLSIAREKFGEAPHPITAEALYGVGVASWHEKKIPDALISLEASLRQQKAMFPDGHPDLDKTKKALDAVVSQTEMFERTVGGKHVKIKQRDRTFAR